MMQAGTELMTTSSERLPIFSSSDFRKEPPSGKRLSGLDKAILVHQRLDRLGSAVGRNLIECVALHIGSARILAHPIVA
jgi:hypothetical protein